MQRDMGKYVVVKVADAKQALTPVDFEALCDLSAFVDEFRVSVGKHPMECVVVEVDWPEYEAVWQMISDRVDGEQNMLIKEGIHSLNARILELEAQRDAAYDELHKLRPAIKAIFDRDVWTAVGKAHGVTGD